MYVTFSPEDGDAQTWEFNPGRVRVAEQIAIEKAAGLRWDEWVTEVKLGRASARRVLLWAMLRREHPARPLADTPDFLADELVVELSPAELYESREAFVKAGGPAMEDGEAMLAALDAQIDEAVEKYGAPGKAR